MRIAAAALFAACLFAPGKADAQYRPNPPRVSPYLNLLRGGATPGLNYVNLVQPDIQTRNSIQQLQTQTVGNQQEIAGLEAGVLPVTGHAFGFQNHLAYFNNLSSAGAANFGVAAAPAQVRPASTSGAAGPRGGPRR
jgi:hypothetical protein